MTVPSWAVTVTVRVLLPDLRFDAPLMVRVALASATVATTETEVVSAGTVKVEPEVTV